jgi:hypothetical protein
VSNNKDKAWDGFLARLEAGEFSPERAALVAFDAGYHAGWLDGQQRPADELEPEPASCTGGEKA